MSTLTIAIASYLAGAATTCGILAGCTLYLARKFDREHPNDKYTGRVG